MRAIEIIAQSGTNRLQITELEQPVPGAGQLLIRVAAAGVNRPDWMQRQGLYPAPDGASPLLGLEVSGTVAAIGPGVGGFSIGDRVCALLTGGGYAEYALASAVCTLPVPDTLNWQQAAAIPETFFTVWSNLWLRGHLQTGDSVLIHGGGSGIGTTAIQLAKAFGARVFVTAGSDSKCQRCLTLGADAAINYHQQDFVVLINDLTQGRGVDLILDMIGGDYLPRNLQVLACEGRLLQIGIQGGNQASIKLWPLMAKRLTISGSTLRNREDSFKALIAGQLHQQVWPLLANGQIQPVIDSVFPLADAERAHQRLLSGEHFGKIILET